MTDVLIADDDDALRRLLEDVLRSAGYRVRAASTGQEALAEVRRDAPDLVVLDYRMPPPDGLEVCRAIRADGRLAHLPVLILTGQAAMEDRLAGFDAGADDYLPKPFDPRELVARVSALLRQARRGLDRNPTTGLPGGDALRVEMERRLAAGIPFVLCYFDLDHFKPFSDRFGFSVADEAIRAAGEAVAGLTDEEPEAYAGHVGGDDFVLVAPPATARGLAAAARARFADELRGHLPPDVVERGTYRAQDRYGIEREFPLTTLSAALLRVRPERWPGMERLGEAVAALKQEAKGRPDGLAEGTLQPAGRGT